MRLMLQLRSMRIAPTNRRRVLRQLRAAWRSLGGGPAEITIRVASDAEVAGLNRRYRHRPQATDILTFPYRDGTGLRGADLVIAAGVLRRQAAQRRVTVLDELLRLCVHGMAHACGYDHHTPTEFAAMRQREFLVLSAVLARPRG